MKIFDIHIGLSDAATQLQKDPTVLGEPTADFPNQFDYIRAKEGSLKIFCSLICPVELNGHDITLPADQKAEINKHLKFFKEQEEKGNLAIVKTSSNLQNTNRLETILGLEGVYFMHEESDISYLKLLIDSGVRIIGPKWNFANSLFNKKNMLTTIGKEFLKVCFENKIIIDLAHSESDIIEAVLTEYQGLVIDSHTCCFEVFEHKRNIQDSHIKEIINRKGIVGLNFISHFVGGNNLKDLQKHFDHFISNFGLDNLAIGSDFDGMDKSDLITDLEDVSKYENLRIIFNNLGLTGKQQEKILFSNAMKFFSSALN